MRGGKLKLENTAISKYIQLAFSCGVLVTEAAEPNLVSDMKWDIPEFDTVLLYSNWSSLRQNYLSKIPTDVNVLSSRQKFREFRTPFPPRNIRKNPRSMCACVPLGSISSRFVSPRSLPHTTAGPLVYPLYFLTNHSQACSNRAGFLVIGQFCHSFIQHGGFQC